MLKNGTKIKIKEDLHEDNIYQVCCVEEMVEYAGMITHIIDNPYEDGEYCIDIDKGEYYWTEDMFDVIEEEIGKGKMVRIKYNLHLEKYKVSTGMVKYAGKIATLMNISSNGEDRYTLDIDNEKYSWHKSLFDLIEEQEVPEFNILENRDNDKLIKNTFEGEEELQPVGELNGKKIFIANTVNSNASAFEEDDWGDEDDWDEEELQEEIEPVMINEEEWERLPFPFEPENVTRFKKITKDLGDLYARKNKDYGNSFKKSHEEFGAVAGLVRMSDKFNRAKQLLMSGEEQQVQDEKIADTLIDLASYSIMLLLELENENKE